MALDADGKPVEPVWPETDVIVGNPPFLGGAKIRFELGDNYVERLFRLYGSRIPNFSDLVCYWYEKARQMIESKRVKRAGFLATQGIRGGANRTVLERIKDSGDIFWAMSDRKWILEGASVRVSMVGFDDGTEDIKQLDLRPVAYINADLTSTVDTTGAHILAENSAICFMGPSPKAPFDIDESTAQLLLPSSGNPNGKPNSDVIRPVASAYDLVQSPRHKWTIDFGLMEEAEAAEYEQPFEYVKRVVLPARESRRDDYRGKWWQYARPRPDMRFALAGKSRYIATPGVSKHRIFVWQDMNVLSNQGTLVFARDDDYFFGILQSRFHELWALQTGTALGATPRYTPTTTFETYPFPWPPGTEPADDPRVVPIGLAAQELNTKRENWLNPPDMAEAELKKRTLTNLYNARPTWLDLAHKKLDAAVATAYGWPADLVDEEILARLLTLNLERVGK